MTDGGPQQDSASMTKTERAAYAALTKNWLGEVVKNVRTRKGITAAQLSKSAGYSPSYVAKIESGTLEPSARAFATMARVLEMKDAEIVFAIRVLSGLPQKGKS